MLLSQMLCDVTYDILSGSTNVEVDDITYDSRINTKGTVFVDIADNLDYVECAVDKGAVAVVVSYESHYRNSDITVVSVRDTRSTLARMSNAYFDYPSSKIFTIGITGTKGKTTTAYMIHTILSTNGIKTGLIGTIETIYGEEWYPQANTTPESYVIYETLSKMVLSGLKAVVMEVSSQGMMMKRCEGILFDVAVFTNISPDHIGENEHKDFEEYMYYKSRLFRQCRRAVVNSDDEHVTDIVGDAKCPVLTYGISNVSDVMAQDIKLIHCNGREGVTFDVSQDMKNVVLTTPGIFNVYNSLAAIAATSALNVDTSLVKKALENVVIKGRLEVLNTKYPFTVIIDYAHNEMSLKNLLTTLKAYNPSRLICCFGCGGNRDRHRRFGMGKVSGEISDITIVTSDNPRFEKPEDIIEDIIEGVRSVYGVYIPIVSRKEAIEYAIHLGKPGDIIVFAGKGHEDYEEVQGKRLPFNERFIIRDMK